MLINNHHIEFIEETHTYLVDGIIVPNISTIIGEVLFPNKYGGIPEYIMEQAREFGTNVHRAIETDDITWLTALEFSKYDEWLGLCLKHKIKPLKHEQIVFYKHEGEVIFIGTLDMVAKILNKLVLIDVKTTYNLDKNYLVWQLSFYALAYEQMYDTKLDGLSTVWLPKRKLGGYYELEGRKGLKEILEVVKKYGEIISK